MNAYDQSARFATLLDGEPVIARVLRGEPVRLRFREWLDTRTTPRPGDTDRTADKVAALIDERHPAQPSLIVFEFQSSHDDDKLDVTLVEAARLRSEVRHGPDRKGKYRVLVGLVYLRGVCPDATLDMTLTSGSGTRHVALLWEVAKDDARKALDDYESGRTTWGILFWVPLMQGSGDAEVIRRWLRLVDAEPDSRRTELYRIAEVFAELSERPIAWKDALEAAQMKTESQVVNRWIESAVEKTRLEERRESLIENLKWKFAGQVTDEVIETINQQPSLPMLQSWSRAMIEAVTFADFVTVLRR